MDGGSIAQRQKAKRVACAVAGLLAAHAASAARLSGADNPAATSCIAPAAEYHHVNVDVLWAILSVESSFNPKAINRNSNNSIDVGIGQMNSQHFAELARYNIAPIHLLDACIGTYVAAWHLSKQYRTYGNTWFAVGAYHSATPYENRRYQILVTNVLKRRKVLGGQVLAVPPMLGHASVHERTMTAAKAGPSAGTSVTYDVSNQSD